MQVQTDLAKSKRESKYETMDYLGRYVGMKPVRPEIGQSKYIYRQ